MEYNLDLASGRKRRAKELSSPILVNLLQLFLDFFLLTNNGLNYLVVHKIFRFCECYVLPLHALNKEKSSGEDKKNSCIPNNFFCPHAASVLVQLTLPLYVYVLVYSTK